LQAKTNIDNKVKRFKEDDEMDNKNKSSNNLLATEKKPAQAPTPTKASPTI
jgi:hypothetical protein